ncbi:MAG: hypothetical protein ACPIOQ_49265, partial [Promethearchaeia archaeon]
VADGQDGPCPEAKGRARQVRLSLVAKTGILFHRGARLREAGAWVARPTRPGQSIWRADTRVLIGQ